MPPSTIIPDILRELAKQKKERPNFPDHICGQVGTINVFVGELNKLANDAKYEKVKPSDRDIEQAAIKTAAAAIRFLESIQ